MTDSKLMAELGRELTDWLLSARPTSAMNYTANFTQLNSLLDQIERVSDRLEAADRERTREATIELLETAVKASPNQWFIYLMLAYYDATCSGDYRAGGERLAAAAALPEAPVYLGSLARQMLKACDAQDDVEVLVAAPESSPLQFEIADAERRRRERLGQRRQQFMSKIEPWIPEAFEEPQLDNGDSA